MKKNLLLLLILFSCTSKSQKISIIPQPDKIIEQAGNFIISPKTTLLITDTGNLNAANFFNDYLQKYYGYSLRIVKKATTNYINITANKFVEKPENIGHYKLSINKYAVTITGDAYEGSFYGIQSLIQLLPLQRGNLLTIPCAEIEDQPRFSYRGMHLDVSRHFFSVDYIKKYIDFIALHKMNYFHWHLTDDQGWRIEIKKYPKLTEIGAWRDGTIIGRYPGTGNDQKKYGGYYTQEQIKDIVKYASERYITVIPEIEMPGHSMAALAAYPELGTDPKSGYAVSQTWGINGQYNNVLNPSEFTFNFLQDVLDEVIKLFPADLIHVGGDECDKRWWKESAFCQTLMKDKGIKNEAELQSYFIQRIEKYLNQKGKRIIGWDEILEGGLAPNALVMSWRGEQGGIEAAKQQHHVIMTPGGWCYFDHAQSKKEDSVTIGGYTNLEKVYTYEPVPAVLFNSNQNYVLGAQGNVWTEYIANESKLEYMIFPRMSALSEVLWSKKENKNWDHFQQKIIKQKERYNWWNLNYCKTYFNGTDK